MWICRKRETLISTQRNLGFCLPQMAFNFASEGLPSPVVCSTCCPCGSASVYGAYDEDSIKWIEHSPCIAGKTSSHQSHERVELSPLASSRDIEEK